MAKNGNDNDKDMTTGRPCKDPQMHALKTAHGTAKRESEYGPAISKREAPVDPHSETD